MTTRVSFSKRGIQIEMPTCWTDFTQKQLRYVFFALSSYERDEAKLHIFCRLYALQIVKYSADSVTLSMIDNRKHNITLTMGQLVTILSRFDFLFEPNHTPVRLESIRAEHKSKRHATFDAVHPGLQGVPFRDYLALENYYQGFLQTRDNDLLRAMLPKLYINDHLSLADSCWIIPDWFIQSLLLWYSSIKNALANRFDDFFGEVDNTASSSEMPDMLQVMNAQIRALTGGDISKEETILDMDCWRALTELNEKAREAREWRQKYGHD